MSYEHKKNTSPTSNPYLPIEDYGVIGDLYTVQLSNDGVAFRSESLDLALSSSISLEEDGQGGVRARFTLREGEWAYFFLESESDHALVPHQPTQEDQWIAIRAQIYHEIMDKGWSEEKQSFVQYYGGDASALK